MYWYFSAYTRMLAAPLLATPLTTTSSGTMAPLFFSDIAKLDVVSDGLLHNQLLNFCQNARMAFLGRNTPTPLLSEFMAQVEDNIVQAV